MKMSLVYGTYSILLVNYVFATSGLQAQNGVGQAPLPVVSNIPSTNASVQQPTDTAAYRTIKLATSSIHDYYMSLSRFIMCLPNVVGMSFTFRVKSCHDARIALLAEDGLYGPSMYEIVIGDRSNRSYIQHISTDRNYILLGEADGMFLNCNEFRQFSISWGGNNISLESVYGNEKKMLRVPYDISTLKYATVATGFGATGEWMVQLDKVDETYIKVINKPYQLLCPTANECSAEGFELINGNGPDCKKNGSNSSIYLKFNYAALCGSECGTEFLQLTVCSSTEQEMCNTCTITNYTFYASKLLTSYYQNRVTAVHVMDVEPSCNSRKDWKMYIKFVHFISKDYGYRTIHVAPVPFPVYYDYYIPRFRICLSSVETMNLTFYVQPCHGGQLTLLDEKGLPDPMYEIGFGDAYIYIHEKGSGGDITKKTETNFDGCGEFTKFWISWKNHIITLGNPNEILMMNIMDRINLTHATVTSGLGTNLAEWQFVFSDKGMLQSVTDLEDSLIMCPFLSECGLKMEYNSCYSVLSDIDIACENSTIYLQPKCNYKDNRNQVCTTDFIQITRCVSEIESGCKTCQLTKWNMIFKAATLCNGDLSRNPLKLFNVETCDFFQMHGWNTYFRYEHFKSRPEAVITTTDSPSTTKDATKTTSHMTPTTTATLPSPTSTASPTTSSMKSTTIRTFDESPQKSDAPLTIGIVVGATGLLLAVICAVVLLIFIRRSKKKEQQQSSTMVNTKGDDYTGNQSVAMPTGSNNPKSGKYTDIQLEIEEQHYQELTEISKTENEVSYDYINPSDVKRKSETGTETENQTHEYIKQVDNVLDFPPKTDGTVYSVLDPNETGFNRSRDLPMIVTDTEPSSSYSVLDPTVTGFDRSHTPTITPAEPYAILDPSATGFNRLENANQSGYEMAKPLNDDHKIGEMSEQPYSSDYNELGDSVVQNVDKNVYSHSVDSVYDSANHNSKSKKSDGNYDHFVGQ